MVSPEDIAGGAGEEEAGGRTASELHRADSPGHNHIPGGRGHTVSERLDGAYIPDWGRRDARRVHGWYYPDPGSEPPEAPAPKVPTADENRY